MTYLFISDLHLSPDHPRLVRGFLALLKEYKNNNTQLYILGDWFNAWIGDDYSAPWLDEIITALQEFTLRIIMFISKLEIEILFWVRSF